MTESFNSKACRRAYVDSRRWLTGQSDAFAHYQFPAFVLVKRAKGLYIRRVQSRLHVHDHDRARIMTSSDAT